MEAASGMLSLGHLFQGLSMTRLLGVFRGRGSLMQEQVSTRKRLSWTSFLWLPVLGVVKFNEKGLLCSFSPAFLGAYQGVVSEKS